MKAPKQGSVLFERATACIAKFNETQDWEGVVSSDPLMLYSQDFREFVAMKCGVNPESGRKICEPGEEGGTQKPLFSQDELSELRDADAKIDAEDAAKPDESEEDVKLDEDARKDNESDEAPVSKGAENEEPEAIENEEAEACEEVNEADVDLAASHNDCHWCGAAPAIVCFSIQAQDSDGENRLIRVDHLCEDCATAYWTALHNVHKERMF